MLAAINRLCFETQGESELKNDFNQNCKLPLSATFIYVDWIEWHIIIPALPRSSLFILGFLSVSNVLSLSLVRNFVSRNASDSSKSILGLDPFSVM